VHRYGSGIDDAAVTRAVGMTKNQSARDPPLDDELPAVQGSVVCAALRDQVIDVVLATFRPKLDVMKVYPNRVATPRNDASPSIASHDLTPDRRWHVLPSPAWSRAHGGHRLGSSFVAIGMVAPRHRPTIHPTQVLRITLGHLGDLGTNFHQLAAPLLPPAATRLANRKRQLVARPTLFGWTSENLTRQQQEGRVIVERRAGISTQLRHCLTKRRIGVSRNVESEHMPPQRRITRIIGRIAWPMPGNELLDLSQRASSRELEPSALVVGRRHPRQLTRGGPAYPSVTERLRQFGQPFECLGHPQPLLCPARFVAQYTLDIFGEPTESEMNVSPGAQRVQEQAPFFPIETRPPPCQPRELVVRAPPIELGSFAGP